MNIFNLSGQVLLLLVFGIIAVTAVLAIAMIRYFYRVSGHERVYKDGIVVTESGIEYSAFPFTVTQKTFNEIDSVELSPYLKVAVSVLFLHYGLNINRVPPNLFGDILVIGFKRPNPFSYLFFSAPKNAADIYQQLKSRIENERGAA